MDLQAGEAGLVRVVCAAFFPSHKAVLPAAAWPHQADGAGPVVVVITANGWCLVEGAGVDGLRVALSLRVQPSVRVCTGRQNRLSGTSAGTGSARK